MPLLYTRIDTNNYVFGYSIERTIQRHPVVLSFYTGTTHSIPNNFANDFSESRQCITTARINISREKIPWWWQHFLLVYLCPHSLCAEYLCKNTKHCIVFRRNTPRLNRSFWKYYTSLRFILFNKPTHRLIVIKYRRNLWNSNNK